MKPAERITASEALPDWDDWDETDREAWKRLLAIRAELRNWTASMSGAEAVDEQRR